MDIYVRVTQLNFETPVTTTLANPLQNAGHSSQGLQETIVTVLAVQVSWLNLEVPVSQSIAELLAISQIATQSLYEDIFTPTPEPQFQPGAGVGEVPMFLIGGRPRVEDRLATSAVSSQTLDEYVTYEETLNTSAVSSQSIEGRYRRVQVFEYQPPPLTPIEIIEPPKSDSVTVNTGTALTNAQKRQREILLFDMF